MRSTGADQRTTSPRTLILGSGVIGSVYAGRLIAAGHDVTMLATEQRRRELRQGLRLVDAQSGQRLTMPVRTIDVPAPGEAFDLVIVAVGHDQLGSTFPILKHLTGRPDILFFGNSAGQVVALCHAFPGQALFGFPAAGGVLASGVVRYVQIQQQKTMLAEPGGGTSARLLRLQSLMSDAGFPTAISKNPEEWLIAHAAFIVPIAYSLQREGFDAQRLARNRQALQEMIRATRQAYRALRSLGNTEIPANLAVLYLHSPEAVAVYYWRRVFADLRGELWFAAHCRSAPAESRSLAVALQAATQRALLLTPDLDDLITSSSELAVHQADLVR
jgi:2-dehydropantoate 2-reductase